MSTMIIALCVVAIAVLLVLQKKNKQANESKKKPLKHRQNLTKTSKGTTLKKEAPKATASSKPVVNTKVIEDQIDLFIQEQSYAKAEGLINLYLNENKNLTMLYPKLLIIYHLQNDHFAIQHLLELVQKLKLNDVYEQLTREYEKLQAQTLIVDEQLYSPTDSLQDLVIQDTTTPAKFDPNLSVDVNNTLEFDHISLHTNSEKPQQVEQPTLNLNSNLNFETDFSIETDNVSTSPIVEPLPELHTAKIDTPILEFKLEQPHTTIEQDDLALTAPLRFNETAPEFRFHVEPEPLANFNAAVDLDTATPTLFAKLDDPIIQAFPELAELNPIDLDIELAEQYIRLGEYAAAKQLLMISREQLSNAQVAKVSMLLQKIA